ncbi:MAG: hypothetical protein RLZZ04_2429 [Cyanobacteriota bacterium]|jgi:filamentous hemagglutinin family protein
MWALFTWLGLSLCTLGYLGTTNNPVLAEARLALGEETSPSFLAQVTSDDTVNTQVTENGNTAEITGGETRGDNLFHSFQDFSVETGNEAFFNNADSISNIFSRVTGGNVSDIDGAIRANGSANLFLINPAGILFGENASLNVGGSFYGSSASSILFEDGEFSAADLDNPPLLTVNAPIGLGFRDQPGDITVRGDGQGTREKTDDLIDTENALRVDSDKTLALVGGKINLEGATIKTPGGRIELGSLQGNEQIGLTPVNEGFGLDYARVQNFQDIQLSKTANIDASGLVAGDVQVQGKNISLTEASQIEASTLGDSLSQDLPGTIKINAIDTIKIDGQNSSNDLTSAIGSLVYSGAVGDSGNLNITTTNLSLTNGGTVNTNTLGQGNAGSTDINATESIDLNNGSIQSAVAKDAEGNGGNLNITTANLSLTNKDGYITAATLGKGNAGSIDINATESITLNNSSLGSDVREDAVGDSGNLNIRTTNLSLTKDSLISANTLGKGNAGSININATESITLDNGVIESAVGEDAEGNGGKLNITTANLSLTTFNNNGGGQINADTFGKGNAGSIDINATESVTLNNNTKSSISSTVEENAEGNGGEIKITTPNLSVEGGAIEADTFGQGDAGKLSINTANLSLNLGEITTITFGKGDAGSIDINATESITLDGILGEISSSVASDAEGNGGNLNIRTANLSLTEDSSINAYTSGQGDAGSIDINATKSITLDDSFISTTSGLSGDEEGNGGNMQISTGDFSISNNASVEAGTSGIGNGGEINIIAKNLSLTSGGEINASTSGNSIFNENTGNIVQGDGGNITIDVADTLSIDSKIIGDSGRAGIFASNQGNSIGNAGNINITTSKLSLINGGQINSFTRGRGNAGNTTINAQDSIVLSGEDSGDGFPSAIFNSVDETARGNGGTISITTKNLDIVDSAIISTFSTGKGDAGLIDINADVVALDNGDISAEAFNNSNGGNLKIDADVIIAFPGKDSNIFASAEQGNGGNITINTESVLGIEERTLNNSTNDINASSEFDLDGRVNINTSDINPLQGATELPSNVVEAKQTTDQTCSANREEKANNGLAIAGRGGVHPAPDTPLNSENIKNENPAQASIPQPLETSQGKIQPARGIKVTKSGKIILTAYRTNNAGERIPEIKPNCN